MKKLLLAIIMCFASSFAANSQTPPLNKQQTLDYINEISSKAVSDLELSATFSLTYTDLERTPRKSSSIPRLYNLLNVREVSLVSYPSLEGEKRYGIALLVKGEEYASSMLQFIVKEDDAKRLKKAFEHLIQLVKTDGDPFGN